MIRQMLAWAFLLALSVAPVLAQSYLDAGGTVVTGVVPIPFPFTPLAPGQHNVAPTVATNLVVPAGTRYATVCASSATVRYTTDGVTVPTNSIGMPLAAGACVTLSGASVLNNFRAVSATGTLDVEYFK